MRPFRFGLLVERFESPAQVLDTARKAEAAGLSTVLIRDHLIEPPFGPQYAPLTTLASIAQVTHTLRVGTLVIANDFRHPAVLAKDVTTLDQLSGGRFELGLGAGFLHEEFQRTGLTFHPNAVRVDRLAEALPVLDRLLRGQVVTHHGTHFQFFEFVNFPPPVQQPRPPILIGAGGSRMLSLAAKYADTIALMPTTLSGGTMADRPEARSPESVARQVELVRNAAGDRFADLELSVNASVIVTTDRERTATEFARQRGWSVPPEQVLQMPSVFIGEPGEIVEQLEHVREHLGISYFIFRDSQLDAAQAVATRASMSDYSVVPPSG
jgi:probable F420-dependent oxidoreductase